MKLELRSCLTSSLDSIYSDMLQASVGRGPRLLEDPLLAEQEAVLYV
jgi:hypothetical protein